MVSLRRSAIMSSSERAFRFAIVRKFAICSSFCRYGFVVHQCQNTLDRTKRISQIVTKVSESVA